LVLSLIPSVHGQIKDSATGFYNPQQNQQEVFYVGANQHVYEAYNDSLNGWLFIDMTGSSNLAAPSGGVTNVTSFWNPQQNLQEVFYVGANQHVYEAYYSNGWIVEDITGGNNLAALNGSMASFWNPQQNL
jgi:Tfp pilus tip-associated adhesin PilY1